MPRVSVREYARLRGITVEAVRKRTVPMGGPIPVHGREKRIDTAEADQLWRATMAPNGAATSRFQDPPGSEPPPPDPGTTALLGNATALTQARTALTLTEAQLRHLRLEQRRGELMSRPVAQGIAFAFARTLRDACQAWPTRIGPALAAMFDLDAAAVTVALDELVRQLLDELASERVTF